MKNVKKPKWDKQEGSPIILTNPEGMNKNPSFVEPLKAGQEVTATIGGIEVVVMLTNIFTTTSAEGKVVAIIDGQQDRDTLGDLALGDNVFIRREDMYSLDIDAGA